METTTTALNVLNFLPATSLGNLDNITTWRLGDRPHRSLFESVWENNFEGMTLTDKNGILVSVGVRVLHARYVKRFLPEANILYASNGQERHEVALKHRPHAIVTDYAMPVMDGFEMLRGLKKDPCTQNIPVFVIQVKIRRRVERR